MGPGGNDIGHGGLSRSRGTVEHHIGLRTAFNQPPKHCAGRQQMALAHHIIQSLRTDRVRQRLLHGAASLLRV